MVVHDLYPDSRVSREVRAAIAEGFEVDVVAMRGDGEHAFEIVEEARVHRLPFGRRRGAGAAGVLWEYVGFTLLAAARVAQLALKRRYRVVQVHGPPDFLMLAAVVPRMLGAGVVFDIHDLAPDVFAMRFGEKPGAQPADRALKLVERAATGFADEVVTVHEPYRRELIARGVPGAKVSVVMNSVDENLLEQLRPKSRDDSGFRVVYHGTVNPAYGLEVLVEAAARAVERVPSLRLEIYGHGDSLPEIRARAAALGIADRLELPGFLPQGEVLAAVAGASVGVIPNQRNRLNRFALSTKLFEYVVLDIPVVCADLPTLREHFSPDELLFYRPGDAEELASALVEIATEPGAAAGRAAAAKLRYDEYRWPVSAQRYAAALRRAERARSKA
jgi:glycosyltransferase involved in cell wall biosynthesis